MTKNDKDVPELVRAAQALEDDLAKFEELSKAVLKIRLDSEKHIARADKELGQALVLPERLAQNLRAVAAALTQMQARQQASLEPLAALAASIRDRRSRLDQHLRAFAALGEAASAASARLQAERENPVVLGDVAAGLEKIGDDARALFEAARSDDFPDVAREAEALHQRIAALSRRLASVQN